MRYPPLDGETPPVDPIVGLGDGGWEVVGGSGVAPAVAWVVDSVVGSSVIVDGTSVAAPGPVVRDHEQTSYKSGRKEIYLLQCGLVELQQYGVQ